MCGEPIIDVAALPKEVQDRVYRPKQEELGIRTVEMVSPNGFGSDDRED